jgi:hypothetical protein
MRSTAERSWQRFRGRRCDAGRMVTAKKREEEAYRDAEAGLGMQRETDMVMRQGLGRGRGCEN